MNIEIEKLIEIVVMEVLAALAKTGIRVDGQIELKSEYVKPEYVRPDKQCEIIDMTAYRTPVLTEKQIASLLPEINEILIPEQTVMTPGARSLIKKRNITIRHKI